ncbi:MAG: EpsG family protein [Lentimicrobium sp.]|jgi:hypothetical protein|nr:EpsG family protein [Lentimicrobium sp.]
MIVYILIFLSLLIFSFVETLLDGKATPKLKLLQGVFCFSPLFLLVVLRSTGFDYDVYESSYDILHFSDFIDSFGDIQFEPSFILLNIISPSFAFLIALMGVLTLSIKYLFIKKISPYPVLSLLVLFLAYVLNFEMGQIRQALSMSIMLYSVLYFQDRKKILLFILIAALFHYSALIFLLAVFLPRTVKKWYFYAFLLVLSVILYFIAEPFIYIISNFLPGFSGAKLLLYYEMEKGEIDISIPLLTLKVVLIVFFYLLRLRSVDIQKNNKYDNIFNIYFLSLFIYIAFAFFPQISGRGGAYFGVFEIILVPIILKGFNLLLYRVIAFLVFISIYFYIFIKFLIKWGESYIPYTTWLF